MAPHYIVLAIGLVVLGVAQLLVYLDESRSGRPEKQEGGLHAHPGDLRMQRMP